MGDFFRRYVLRHFWMKVVSLLLAAGLWLAIQRDPVTEVLLTVPIEFHNFPDNLEIASQDAPQAQVRVRGPERVIRQLRQPDVHVVIDLTGTKIGERTIDLTAQNVREPREIEVVQIVPGQLHMTFDMRMIRQVEVRPRVTGTFASGLRIAQVLADPAFITISGPRRQVESAESATTDPVDVSGTVERASFITHAYVSDPLIQVVRPKPIRVTVIMERAGASGGGSE
ncbi:MAG TPA: CdaR family protein [Terriglobales bacterium]|nr:CdaR family protein [Terriglobales bacterium]